MNREQAVSVIEGIGPVVEEKLKTLGVFCPLDLLRHRVKVIHEAVSFQASIKQVSQWRRAASLLQIECMNGQWAEALVRGGVETIQGLSRADLSKLRTLFANALAEGVIPKAPDDEEIVAMFKDAVTIKLTGVIRGTVIDADGVPLAGVSARVGQQKGVTDLRGRFDICRIPLGKHAPLILKTEDEQSLVIDDPAVSRDVERIDVRIFRFSPRGESEPKPNTELSELQGGRLQNLSGRRVRSRTRGKDDLRENDVLMVREFRERDETYRVVSKLKSVINGELFVHAYKLPATLFEQPVSRGDLYRVKGGELLKLDQDKLNLSRYKRWLLMQTVTADLPTPETDEDFRKSVEVCLDALARNGWFNRERKGN